MPAPAGGLLIAPTVRVPVAPSRNCRTAAAFAGLALTTALCTAEAAHGLEALLEPAEHAAAHG
ncbi:hypothetical protein ACFQ1I_07155 [Kitasatospora arboriphila]